jgi:pepF/M3 family oligoendopeptidase
MNQRWSLDELYKSFESEKFKKDYEKCCKEIEEIKDWAEDNLKDSNDAAHKMRKYVKILNKFYVRYTRLYYFAQLTLSVEARNEKALKVIDNLEGKYTELTKPQVNFEKWLGSISNIDDIIKSDSYLKEFEYFFHENLERSKYLLSDKEEVLISKMKTTGSAAWEKLQELLTSTLLVDITIDGEEKKLPLPVVRNMAYDKSGELRKTAYEAELKAYLKVDESLSASLNGIKGEVITVSKMKGYKSPLEKTILDSRMDMETLDAMLAAMRESLPDFHRYFRKKAELMGYSNGLPFYEMFAPMGNMNMQFSYMEARDYIVANFRTVSNSLASYAANAFDSRWIDAEPREGKRGGAFCENLHSIGESRILANFDGSFNSVITLAHELGHGYHGACLKKEEYLNSDYPMPIAETASIFCETIVKEAALKAASEEETFTILESSISDSAQVVVDIMSRFLFESELFKRRESGSLSVKELKEIMLNAQKEAYGNGLDTNFLHPYMWLCKPHYYSADYNFYNFPYAFGLLFSKGLYAEYLKRGMEFIAEYDRMLSVTGKMNISDVAKVMNIDVHKVDFWRSSLELIKNEIDKFVKLR